MSLLTFQMLNVEEVFISEAWSVTLAKVSINVFMNYHLESNIPFSMRRGTFLFVISLSTGLMICALTASSFGSAGGLWHTIISISSCSETFVMREKREGDTENDAGNNEWKDQRFFQVQNI